MHPRHTPPSNRTTGRHRRRDQREESKKDQKEGQEKDQKSQENQESKEKVYKEEGKKEGRIVKHNVLCEAPARCLVQVIKLRRLHPSTLGEQHGKTVLDSNGTGGDRPWGCV